MNEIASKGQLRLSYLRWALFTVPAVVFLGYLSGRLSNSGYGNRWFAELAKPDAMPLAEIMSAAWGIVYVLMGLAIAMVLHARGAQLRLVAILAFLVLLAGNLAWLPVLFGMHKVGLAFYLLVGTVLVALITALLFWAVRKTAALLMLPCLVWLGFTAFLNYQLHQLNPQAEKLVPAALRTHI